VLYNAQYCLAHSPIFAARVSMSCFFQSFLESAVILAIDQPYTVFKILHLIVGGWVDHEKIANVVYNAIVRIGINFTGIIHHTSFGTKSSLRTQRAILLSPANTRISSCVPR
jgi:hypothetical protein